MKRTLLISLLLSAICFPPSISQAQFNFGSMGIGNLADELNVNISPTYPKPNESVLVTLEMYTENIDTADITWLINGKKVAGGKGLTRIDFRAPPAGIEFNLTISVALANGASFEKNVLIRPANVEILWEGNAYTPPFYRGKALFPPQGQVKLLAIPTMKNSGNLVYKWTINGEVRQSISGYGKNSAIVFGPILGKPMEVEVLVTDPATNATADGNAFIQPTNLDIVFYENSPLYGIIFEKAINNFSLKTEESSIFAAPFYLSRENMNSAEYAWKINDQNAEGINGRSATFRKPEGTSGSSLISFRANNPLKPLQFAESSFSITFSQ